MAKIYGLFGSMTGKLADTVLSVRNGVQIARKYQPVVYNPSTAAQVAQRAKLKALSQLSAVMAPVIAMPKQGSVSGRNLFTKVNFPAVSFSDNTASINLTGIKLTRGVVSLPSPVASFSPRMINVSLEDSPALDVNRVVYVAFMKGDDNSLRLAGSTVVNVAGADNTYEGVIPVRYTTSNYVIYAYGIRDNNENARTTFGNLTVADAALIATLIVTRTLTETDVTLSETRAILLTPSE